MNAETALKVLIECHDGTSPKPVKVTRVITSHVNEMTTTVRALAKCDDGRVREVLGTIAAIEDPSDTFLDYIELAERNS